MSNVELVIKLPKEVKNRLCFGVTYLKDIQTVCEALCNGIPLPKGHGRLITEPTEEEIAETIGGKNDFADCIRDAVKTVFTNAQTIIEADKAESNRNC